MKTLSSSGAGMENTVGHRAAYFRFAPIRMPFAEAGGQQGSHRLVDPQSLPQTLLWRHRAVDGNLSEVSGTPVITLRGAGQREKMMRSWRAARSLLGGGADRQHPLRQQVAHDMAVHVGEPEVAALVAEGEALVVESEEVEHGRVQVVHVHGLLRDGVAELVRAAVR